MYELSRRTLMKGTAAGAAAAFLPTSLFAQSQRPSIVVAMPTQPDYPDPVMLNNTPALRSLNSVYDGLLRMEYLNDLKLAPAIAESWTRTGPTTIEFKLRPNVKFHDGSIVTTDDVVFSLSDAHVKGPGGNGQTVAKAYQATISKVEAPNATTIRITTRIPDPVLEQKLAAWSSQIVSRAAFEKAGSWEKWFAAPVGAGPYKIVRNQKDVGIIIESHDDYWGGLPPFKRVEFRVVPESSSRINGLLAGDYDIITDVLPDQFDTIEKTDNLELIGGGIPNVRTLTVDTSGPILSDVRIRRALSLAIDRQLIVEQLWHGRISVPNGAQYPSFGALYEADFPKPAYDPEQARKLVVEAGYQGEPIAYRLLNNWYPNQVATAQIMVEMWRAVGLNVVLQPVENFSQVERKPIHAIFDNSMLLAWPDPTGLVWRQFRQDGGPTYRLGVWDNPEFQQIGSAFENSTSLEERRKLQHRSLELIDREVPFVILHDNGIFYAKKKDVAWGPYPSLLMDFGPFNAATRAAL